MSNFLLFDGYLFATGIGGDKTYEDYRNLAGKPITLIYIFSYLTPLELNFLMTINRVFIVLFPLKFQYFSERRILSYCIFVMFLSILVLLIPYFSECSINFHAHPVSFISACAPGKHLITQIQNKYTILVPVVAMVVNFVLIFYMHKKSKLAKLSKFQTKQERSMIRQAAFIATYISVYEIGNLLIRIFPEFFSSWSSDAKDLFYFFRCLTICSLNFFVYFVFTKSTRTNFLEFYRWKKSSDQIFVTSY